jgi:YD repeat-containing protein
MVNIGTGNLLLQEDDMNVPHKGVALAYRRTYNMQSGHDVNGSDGSAPTLIGNGWTSTWDAHISGDPTHAIAVWDIDGARYDYVLGSDGKSWLSQTAGQHATLTSDGKCGMLWTKKSGTLYHFYALNGTPSCGNSVAQYGGYSGRLFVIYGRNQNTWLRFSYVWDNGDSGPTGKVANLTAFTESGLQATLVMSDFNGHRLASSLSRPDGTVYTYGYDGNGNLTVVNAPPNNAGTAAIPHMFAYGASSNGASYMVWASSPRWAGTNATDGSYLYFGVAPTGTSISLSSIGHVGYVNPVISDGVSSGSIQSAPTGSTQFSFESYGLGTLGTPSTETFRDSDGHSTNWVTNAAGSTTQTQECTATQNQQCTGTLLVSGEQWDANNNLVSEIEPRGFAPGANQASYETDYAYDANGNTTAVAAPPVNARVGSGVQQLRPTQLYSYDQYNNVVAYCDQTWSQQNGKDWDVMGNPGSSDALCPLAAGSPTQPGATVMTYASPSWAPFGQVTAITTPMGYQRTISYAASGAGTDYGLPVAVTGTAVTQVDGVTPLQLNQTFSYDTSGNLVSYGTGTGTWNLAYDALDRLTVATDPDGHASYTSYFANGAVSKTETSAQHAANIAKAYPFDAGVLYTYDLDGDELTQVHHHGNLIGTTQNWYDGADRLVEVALPGDSSAPAGNSSATSSTAPVHTRYLYDLSGGGTVSVGGMQVHAYGNLYDTQEFTTTSANATAAYVDARGQAFDALNRVVAKITFPPNADTTAVAATSSYDQTYGTWGLLSSTTDAVGESTVRSYDALGRMTDIRFSGDNGITPHRTYGYDPNGRAASITSDAFGVQTSRYDADGRLTSVTEPSGGGMTSPAVIGYDYYSDGHRKDLTVQSSALSAPALSPLMTYMYRADGQRTALTFHYGGVSYPFTWTYTNAGRRSTQTDPYTGAAVPHPAAITPPAATYAAKQWTYDANGDVRSLSLPVVGKYAAMTHDLEGALSGYGVQPSQKTNSTAPANFVYQFTVGSNQVGETTGVSFANPAPMSASQISSFSYSNGHAIPYPGNLNGYPHSGYTNYELIDGVRTTLATYGKNSEGGLQCPNPSLTSEQYDTAGRHTSTAATLYDSSCYGGTYTDTTAYDAENHPVQAVQTGAVPSDIGTETWGLQWGPNGHPIALQQSPNSTTLAHPSTTYLHYDGDILLFTTYDTGQLADVRPELLGMYSTGTAPKLSVQDRDFAELNVTSHSASDYSGLNYGSGPFHDGKITVPETVYEPASDGSQPDADTGQPEVILQYTHADGFYTPLGRIQGVRAMDTDLGTWKSPDVYAGDVRDPLSQKPYMWNGNNPYEYSDPSGYHPEEQEQVGTPASVERLVGARGYTARTQANARQILGVPENAPKISEKSTSHMFREADGHVPDTPTNRAIIQKTASDSGNVKLTKSPNSKGDIVTTYAKILPSGAEAWARVWTTKDASGNLTSVITNGGINQKPLWPH